MQQPLLEVSDRTGADDAIEFVHDKLRGYDLHLLDWVRLYPMTEQQHLHCAALFASSQWASL